MKEIFRRWKAPFLYILVGFLMGGAVFFPFFRAKAFSEDAQKYLHILHEITAYLETDYVEKVEEADLYKGAIQGILSTLKDPHTRFMGEEEFSDLQTETKGSFGGLGIEVVFMDGKIIIVTPIDDTPASRAGIQPQDKIIEINGKSTTEMSLNDAIQMMRGEVGSGITLKIERSGVKPFNLDLVREKIKIQYIKTEYLEKEKLGYIRLLQFMGRETTTQEFVQAVESFQKKGAKGLIIDLRNNPGGLLDLAVELSELFLDPGKEVVSVRGRGDKLVRSYKASSSAGKFRNLPLVVLMNQGSASASEILGGALKDHNRAKLVGSKSFGKGSVQNIYNLPYNTGFAITIQKYYTPSGITIHGKGIEPNVSVPGIQPEPDDKFYLEKMNREDLLKDFTQKNPDYTEAKAKEFLALLQQKKIRLSPDLAKFLYYNETMMGNKRELIQLEFDPQLRKAIEMLSVL